MEQVDAIKIVKDIISGGLRHKNYLRTCQLAKEYKAIITGEGIEPYMKKFDRRETQDEFNQRVSLTVNITSTVCGNLIDPQKKLSRSNSIEKTLLYTDNNIDKFYALNRIINTFYQGNKSVESYMSKVWIEQNNIDPNSLLIVDWATNRNGERIKPYPVEYEASQVYHFNIKNGILEWVCVHRDEQDFDPEMYILYSKDFTVIFTRTTEPEMWPTEADINFYKELPIDSIEGEIIATFKDHTNIFWNINIPKPHNMGVVPAKFFGFSTDLYTKTTYLSAIYKAFPLLKKVIKANSELDLTMALHAFPQKIQYTDPCPSCGGKGKSIDGTVCEDCHGTGLNPKQVQRGALDVMQVPKPRDKEDMIPLENFIYYVKQEVELLKFQDEYVDKLTKKCKEAVYNSEVFSRKDVAETAYGKNIDLQNVYDALWEMACAYSEMYNFIIDVISKVTDLEENLIHRLSFRKDFKMKSLTDLYQDLVLISTSNADEFVKKAAEDDIAEVLYESDSRELLKYKTSRYFFPFNGKTKEEVMVIVTNPSLVREKTVVLWANFSYVFDELEMEYSKKNVDFYILPREKQKEAIDKKVEEIIEGLNKQDVNVGKTLSGTEQEEQQVQGATS